MTLISDNVLITTENDNDKNREEEDWLIMVDGSFPITSLKRIMRSTLFHKSNFKDVRRNDNKGIRNLESRATVQNNSIIYK